MIETMTLSELAVNEQLQPLQKKAVTKVQLAQYAAASGDLNPLHLDDDFARKVGLGGVIAHGMLVMGFLGEYVMDIARDQATVVQFKMRFGKMTVPGDEIRCSGIVEKIYEENGRQRIVLQLSAEKQTNEVVGAGTATLELA